MKRIDKKHIANGTPGICDAVMSLVIPRLNELIDEVNRLQQELSHAKQAKSAGGYKGPPAAPPADSEEDGLDRTLVEAVGATWAARLTKAGYVTVDAVKEASDELLLEISGVGEARLQSIRESLS